MQILFGQLIAWLSQYYTRQMLAEAYRISITVAAISLGAAALVSYYALCTTFVDALKQSVPAIVSGVWSWVMPENASICLIASMSATLIRFFTRQYQIFLNQRFMAAIQR